MTITVRIVNQEGPTGRTARIDIRTAVMDHGQANAALESQDLAPGESRLFTIHKGKELLVRDEY